ncbi:MAG: hypothetical protein VB039_05220 [Oscillospiraceae bacterium]|nr:hypothetical protein [Oscillospiraceae bacterium]
MKTTEMYLCAQCREELRGALTLREIPGHGAEKRMCAYCRRRCYGGMYEAEDAAGKDSSLRSE